MGLGRKFSLLTANIPQLICVDVDEELFAPLRHSGKPLVRRRTFLMNRLAFPLYCREMDGDIPRVSIAESL